MPADKFPNRFDVLLSSYGFSKLESVLGADTAVCIKTVSLFYVPATPLSPVWPEVTLI